MTDLETRRSTIPAPRRAPEEHGPVCAAPLPGYSQLQQLRGTVEQAERFRDEQMTEHLNARMREFISRQEMMFIATADRRGACSTSFRAGPPGFVQVLDASRLMWPEYRGNGYMASAGNVLENPHIGLLFMDFIHDTIGLHVNGRVEIVTDEIVRAAHPGMPVDLAPGRRPLHWLTVHVEEAYIHCSKHIPHLTKAPADSEDRTRGTRADFFGVRAEKTAELRVPTADPADTTTDPATETRRWSLRRALTTRHHRRGPR